MLDQKSVEHIAKLARLELSPAEVETFQRQLSDIVGHIETLKQLNCDGVEPLIFPGALADVLRDDTVGAHVDPAKVFVNAPEREGNLFKVPKVVDR